MYSIVASICNGSSPRILVPAVRAPQAWKVCATPAANGAFIDSASALDEIDCRSSVVYLAVDPGRRSCQPRVATAITHSRCAPRSTRYHHSVYQSTRAATWRVTRANCQTGARWERIALTLLPAFPGGLADARSSHCPTRPRDLLYRRLFSNCQMQPVATDVAAAWPMCCHTGAPCKAPGSQVCRFGRRTRVRPRNHVLNVMVSRSRKGSGNFEGWQISLQISLSYFEHKAEALKFTIGLPSVNQLFFSWTTIDSSLVKNFQTLPRTSLQYMQLGLGNFYLEIVSYGHRLVTTK